jgi:hypothetical protein
MAQWWELVIPAALTLLGAWSGSWWQSRSTDKQLAWQANEADKSRRFTAQREDQARWFDERRTAYAELGKRSHVLMLAAYGYWTCEAELQEATAHKRPGSDLSDLETHRDKALDAFNAAGDAAREAMVSVQVVASEQQAKIAEELDVEWEKMVREPPDSYDEFAAVRERFLAQARAELSETALSEG